MKSLEIVNEVLEENDYGIIGAEELQQIKQDLEVLEILRKYLYLEEQSYDYDWEDGNTWMDYFSIKDIEDIDEHWQDDYKKVKQWLEENDE